MRIERTKNAARNILWGTIERIVRLVLPFVTRTVMIKVLGAEYLGLNSLFVSILSVLSISELGVGTAIVFSMYKPIAEDDMDMLCALLNVYKKVYHVIGTIILICGTLIAPLLPYLINGEYPVDINIYILYFIYLLDTVISYFLFAYKTALFSAYQRNDLISKRSVVINFASNIFKIVMLLTIQNYYAYVVIIPLTTIITNLANAYLANKVFPNIACCGNISRDTKKGIKKRIIGLVSFKIYNVIFTSVDTIVISTFLGLVPLAIYNNYYYVQTCLIGFLSILTASITAGVGNKMVINKAEENYKDFKNFTFANGWLSSWCAVCMFCLYQHFMQWWVGEELVFPFKTMTLMVLYFFLPRITTMTYTYREAAGLWWEDRFRPIVSTIVNLLLNLILVRIIGMDGVIISTLICTVLINVPWGTIVLFKNYFKRSPKEYFIQLAYYLGVTIAAGICTMIICSFLPNVGVLYMMIKGCVCVAVPNIVFCFFYHKLNEYLYIKRLVQRMVSNIIKRRV